MSVEIMFHWERGWMLPQFEIQVWDDLALAFNVSALHMIPDLKMNAKTPLYKYDTFDDFLNANEGKKLVYVIPPDEWDSSWTNTYYLRDYEHPADCVYIFGASFTNLPTYVTPEDDVIGIETPVDQQIWQWQVAGMVLYDRLIKSL
ncbi:hypothetical protein DRO19_05500 [Candidatus Bathyarchaeota archaeon]|nr:MAG: hypothetical protein DRO19_05500 [Candidatus Bathyarchaeota archaeon]